MPTIRLQRIGDHESETVAIDRVRGAGLAAGPPLQAADRFDVTLRGRTATAELSATSRDGSACLHIDGRVVPFHSVRRKDEVLVWIAGRTFAFHVSGRSARRAGTTAAAIGTHLSAPMPGAVLKVNIAPGGVFAAHQPLVVLESMKMEMTLSAPHAGCARDVLCREGDLVEMGATLIRFEDSVEDRSGPDKPN